MLSKSLIQYSVDGWSCVPSLLFTWGQTMVEVMKITVTTLKRSHACTARVHAPNLAAGHHRPTPPPETPGHPHTSLGQSPVGSLFLSPGFWCTRFCCALQESISLSHVSSGSSMVGLMAILQEDLCHTHTQSPRPHGRPLQTSTFTGDAQTQFCFSLCGVPGS